MSQDSRYDEPRLVWTSNNHRHTSLPITHVVVYYCSTYHKAVRVGLVRDTLFGNYAVYYLTELSGTGLHKCRYRPR